MRHSLSIMFTFFMLLPSYLFAGQVSTGKDGFSVFDSVSDSYLKNLKKMIGSCAYVKEKTRLRTFKKDNYCGGADLKFCFAVFNCNEGKGEGKEYQTTCAASSGKCPADPLDCIEEKGFDKGVIGEAAIANKSPNQDKPVAKPSSARQ